MIESSTTTNDTSVPSKATRSPLIALAGQPNMGKSTIFNYLTGLNQHVGNWPGKTVEQREGHFSLGGQRVRLVDLPGTYSLTANSPEEIITREFILREKPDLVIAVISAANLERSLYLVSELVALPSPLLVALNMMDVAEQEGLRVEPHVLEAALGVPVIPTTATHAEGIDALLQGAARSLAGELVFTPKTPEIRADHRDLLRQVTGEIDGFVPEPYPTAWVALKLLEGDNEIHQKMQAALPLERWEAVQALLKGHDDALLAIASGRYAWIERMVHATVFRPRLGQISLTDRLDRWATHPIWGVFILAGILAAVFGVTFAVGSPLQTWLDGQVVHPLAAAAAAALSGAPSWIRGFVVNALIGGVGSVLTFLPILAIFFATFGLLEDVGYMARAAYVMDNLMHLMGLHGKSFLPIFLGFGCNVPAVMGTRVIDSWPARLLTILVSPFVPCTARMAVVAFLAPAFFGSNAIFVTWGLVLLSLFMLIISGIVLNRLIFKGQRSAFIMEMPLYHRPNTRTIGLLVWERSLSFVKKAGTTILAISVLIWVLSTLPNGDIQSSILAQIGQWLEPVGRVLGFDWRLTVAMLTSFLAKENAVATLAVLTGGGESAGLSTLLASTYSAATALSYLTVGILFVPCAATVAVIRQETGSWRWTLVNIGLMLLVSLTAGVVVYHLALGLGL